MLLIFSQNPPTVRGMRCGRLWTKHAPANSPTTVGKSDRRQKKHWPVHKNVCPAQLDMKVKEAERERGKGDGRMARARFDASLSHQKQV